jgi:exo-1,4-beta-D-glucosaminidase
VEEDSVTKIFSIPVIERKTYLVRLSLRDSNGKELSSNVYWLSQQPDVLDWAKGNEYFTPERSFADLSELQELRPVKLEVVASYPEDGMERVTVHNPTTKLAFSVHLSVVDAENGEELLPVRWEDNYFSLWPGERRTLKAKYRVHTSAKPAVRVDGWNCVQ